MSVYEMQNANKSLCAQLCDTADEGFDAGFFFWGGGFVFVFVLFICLFVLFVCLFLFFI